MGSSFAPHAVSALASMGSGFLGVARVVGGMGVLAFAATVRIVKLQLDWPELVRNLHKMGVSRCPSWWSRRCSSVPSWSCRPRRWSSASTQDAARVGRWVQHPEGDRSALDGADAAGRIGANNTAELGTMVVTEQIDALRALAIDPLSYLIVPRFLGMTLTFFLSTVFSDVLALSGAALVGDIVLQVDPLTFYQGVTGDRLGFGDVAHGLIKSVTFGIVIGLSSCHYGLSTSGGAPGVGRAVDERRRQRDWRFRARLSRFVPVRMTR